LFASSIDCQRFSGAFWIIRMMAAASCGGQSGRASVSGAGVEFRCAYIIATGVLASKGTLPVSSS